MVYQSVKNRPAGLCIVLFLEQAGKLIALEPVEDEEWERFVRDVDLQASSISQ